ncbi:hypothetical protein C8Q74DRAFT_1221656 [Fomes fomentarius]|nr:hypothetical protein C8Q74DRAFT_1221656 [Fomes fomentarius]
MFKAKKKMQTTLGINKPSSLASVGPFKRSSSFGRSTYLPAPMSPTESAVPNATFNPSSTQPKRAPIKTLCETYAPYIAARFPQFPIHNNFDRLELGLGAQTYEDLVRNDEIRARLDEQWKIFVALNGGNADSTMLRITRWLDLLMEIMGPKPMPGDDVTILSIPITEYCLQLWPALLVRQEYCVDFAYTKHQFQPVGTPKGFKLYIDLQMVPPWLHLRPHCIYLIEHFYNIPLQKIKPEAENYILQDVLMLWLKYPGGTAASRLDVPIR